MSNCIYISKEFLKSWKEFCKERGFIMSGYAEIILRKHMEEVEDE